MLSMTSLAGSFCLCCVWTLVQGVTDCPSGRVAYVKTVGHVFSSQDDDTRTFSGVSLQTCEDLCTTNEDRRGNRYYCKSFNYQASAATCILSNYRADRFQEGTLLEAGLTRMETDHFEKHCIQGAEPCPGEAASFTRVPQHILSGYAHHPTDVSSLEECLAECLMFKDDAGELCRSVMYFYEDAQCIINKVSRFDHRDNFVSESFDVTVDYFDNYCIGEWAPWSAWSSCSTTCGHGLAHRNRVCSLHGRCSGDDEERKQCYVGGDCGQRAQWSEWGPCSVTCGRGERTRQQKCPRFGSAFCREETETDLCVEGSCSGRTFDDGWDAWGSWSACDATCGQGNRYRTRSCRRSNCQGSVVDTSQCVGPRDCSAAESRRLSLGGWQGWTGWSRCSTDCGRGTQVRSRPCPERRECQLSDYVQTKTCFEGAAAWCHVGEAGTPSSKEASFFRRPVSLAGQFDQWGSWSPCTVTCGGGLKTRMRSCRLSRCTGDDRETQSCNTQRCESKWGVWSPWTSCSPACGRGTRKRVRLCISGQCPFQSTASTMFKGGSGCRLSSEQQDSCQTSCGSQWNAWSPWSDCSATCGSGTKQRKRTCPRDETCRGDDRQSQSCHSGKQCSLGPTAAPVRPSASVGDKEADERFYQCCVSEGIAEKCAKATCRYDVTLEESIDAIFDDSFQCDLANVNKANKCASDGNDNSACCTSAGIGDDCIGFCRPPAAGAATQSEDDLMLCSTFLRPTLDCHRKGLKPR